MKIKYCDKDEFIVIEQFSAVTPNRLHIVGNNIISDTSGFDIYDDDEETI